jgi:molybdopterin synthase sulfur carrier subunit
MKILFFSSIAEITGCPEIVVHDCDSTADLKLKLEERFPALKKSRYAIALNKRILPQDESLKEDDVVALLPPFSGG